MKGLLVAKASKETLAELEMLLNTVASDLPKVSGKKMFGCHALWTKEQIFGLVWKEGRIGVRLPDEGAYSSLMGAKGSAPWKAGPMTMAHWVLVPEGMHAKGKELKKWVEKAHQLAQLSSIDYLPHQ